MPKRTPLPAATVAEARTSLAALGWSCEELHQRGRGAGAKRGPLTPASSGYWVVIGRGGDCTIAGKAKEQLAAWLSLVEQAEKIG